MKSKDSGGEKIRAARQERGISQEDLAKAIGISQPAINMIEIGKTTKSKHLHEIESFLGIADELPKGAIPLVETAPHKLMPVFGMEEGSGKVMFFSREAIDLIPCPTALARVSGVYGLYVRGTTMAPRYRPGETIIVHPHLPPTPTDGVVIFSPADNKVQICEYVSETESDWIAKIYKPTETELRLPKADWPKCHLIYSVQMRR